MPLVYASSVYTYDEIYLTVYPTHVNTHIRFYFTLIVYIWTTAVPVYILHQDDSHTTNKRR